MSSSPSEREDGRRQAIDEAAQAPADAVWTEMRRRWRAGDRVAAETYLSGPAAVLGESQVLDLIYGEFCLREELGERPSPEEYEHRFPRFATEIRRQITVHRALSETIEFHSAAATRGGESHEEAAIRPYIPPLTSTASFQQAELPEEVPLPSAIGKYRLGFGIETLRTLAFLVIVFGNQATTYTNRTRQHLWSTRPSSWLVLSSVADLLIASTMANRGFAMAPLPLLAMAGTLVGAVVFAFMLDIVKVPVFNRLGIA